MPSESKVSERQSQLYVLWTKINGTNICAYTLKLLGENIVCESCLQKRINSKYTVFSLSMATQYHTRHFLVYQCKERCIIFSFTSLTNILVSEWGIWPSYEMSADQQLSLLAIVSTLLLYAITFSLVFLMFIYIFKKAPKDIPHNLKCNYSVEPTR
jgi:hypothetical protein